MLRVAHRLPLTEAEGPGRRFALWVQGCALRCPGCCNPELFEGAGGEILTVARLADELRAAARAHDLDGLTIVGGEPLEQLPGVTALAEAARAAALGVIVFTGYTWGEAATLPGFERLYAALDTLVSGRFDARRREPDVGGRRFIGSTNQRLHHRSARYADPDLWAGPAALELRIAADGTIALSGDPALSRRVLPVLRGRGPRGRE
ncbi:MAG: radical SAM protein [Myxococcales bacterium]|nr:radical SAM protein [Myxococcales bacterium]